MDLEEILAAARAAIEAGESADDVAAWITEGTGMSIEEIGERVRAQRRLAADGGSAVGDFVHQAAEGATLGQAEKFAGVAAGQLPNQFARPDDPRFQNRDARREAAAAAFQQRTDDLSLLAPEASAAAIAAPAALAGIGGASLLPRLGPAVGAIRGLGGRVAGNPILRRLARGALTGVGASGGGLATFRLLRGMLD